MPGVQGFRTFVFALAAVVIGGVACRAEQDPAPLTTVRAVADSCLRPGPYPAVALEAVVTGRFPNGSLVIRDETGATFVHGDSETEFATVAIGDRIRVRGVVHEGVFTNGVKEATVETLAAGPRPAARRVSLAEFASGGCYHDHVALAGVVRSVSRHPTLGTILGLDVEGRTIETRCVPPLPEADERRLVDAAVNVAGFGGGEVAVAGHLLRPFLWVLDPADVQVVTPAPADPFAAAAVPLARLARVPRSGHRVKVAGVAAARGGLGGGVFLANDDQGLFVEPAVLDDAVRRIAPGDRVEAVGFVTMGPASLQLGEAVVRVVGKDAVPPARQLPSDFFLESVEDWERMHRALWSDALPVELQMTVTARVDRGGGSELVGTGGPRQMTIRCFVPDRPAAAAVPGSVVAARGVYRVMATDRDKSRPLPDAIDLWADSAADVWMVRQPPWWGRPDVVKPLAATLAVCLAAAFGTGAWVLLLRRQVRAQSVQLATEIRSRRDAALEFEATLRERNRLAANLHDTLLQTLGGIGYQLDACEGSRARDESEAKVHFDVARRMVNHASNELHSAVWAMRSLPIRDQSFPRAVRTLCDRVGEGHAARIDVATEGDLEELPEFVAGNVLLVVQEAVLNALRHGQAARIDVRVADRPAAEAIDVEVRDDGRGFDAARRRGLDEGHFGIQGMHERAERLGGTLQIESVPGRGTLVRARVRRREFDAELAGAAPGA